VNHYYHLIKVKPQKVFHSASFQPFDKIVEVKNLSAIRELIGKPSDQEEFVSYACISPSSISVL